ncbi:hypothetical protein TIFTF001_015940 [Ficus carica]|uniref:Uncharacterized protein n=1 Tax=Ficus carica TaxID=3494 RepID=A0AA88A830_FICCA|nr:hypothetical protein TIFTF001_015940 [Ficus carica]
MIVGCGRVAAAGFAGGSRRRLHQEGKRTPGLAERLSDFLGEGLELGRQARGEIAATPAGVESRIRVRVTGC